jgi:hypothetical protein
MIFVPLGAAGRRNGEFGILNVEFQRDGFTGHPRRRLQDTRLEDGKMEDRRPLVDSGARVGPRLVGVAKKPP